MKTLEKELREALKGKHESIAGPEESLRTYGNKHLNLVKMERADQFLRLPNLEIPAPKGIQSEEVHAFLRKMAPEVFERWKALKGLSLNTKEAEEHLQAIQEAVGRAFASPETSSMLGPEYLDWLKQLKEKGAYLMVRSTGAEDSKESANAGGNVSRAYVAPDMAVFMQAVGDVVQSYFRKDSLQNRINANTNPFDEPLQLSVTAQELIGEAIGGAESPQDIPVSFVAFTNEPLYVGSEKFRAMRISLTYGHGEGVVGGVGIPTDSVLVLHSEAHPDQLYFVYDNQLKRERLAPQEREGMAVLEKTANPESLMAQPALNPKQLAKLYSSLVSMEAFFEGHPTDVEGVFKKGIFYFVQARPVNRKPLLPTYLKGTEGIVISIQGKTIVPGRASVVIATDRDTVRIETTLLEALKKYQAGVHQLVIVEQEEPQNSHPVVNFSGLAVPCLYVKEKSAVEALMNRVDAAHPLAVCMQTGKASLWDSAKAPLEGQIALGFAVHPAQIAVSLDVDNNGARSVAAVPDDLSALLIQIRETPKNIEQVMDHQLMKDLRENIKTIEDEWRKLPGKGEQIRKILNILQALDQKIKGAVEEARAPTERLQKLLHLKILETLLGGSGTENGVGQYNLMQAGALAEEAFELIAFQKQFSHPVRSGELLIGGKRAGSEESYAAWKVFLKI